MSQIAEFENQLAAAFDRLRAAMARGGSANTNAEVDSDSLRARISDLETEKAGLASQLSGLRSKRDKDVAALDELIAQLKPLIEEA